MHTALIHKKIKHEFKVLYINPPWEAHDSIYKYGSGCTCGWYYQTSSIYLKDYPSAGPISPLGSKEFAEKMWKDRHAKLLAQKEALEAKLKSDSAML